jgi:hypothetical protein
LLFIVWVLSFFESFFGVVHSASQTISYQEGSRRGHDRIVR